MSKFLHGATYVLGFFAFLCLFQPDGGVLLTVLFGFAAAVCYGFAVGAERKEDAGRNVPETHAPSPEVENWLRSKINWPNCGVHRDNETGAVTTWKPGDGIDDPGGPQAKAQVDYLKREIAAKRAQQAFHNSLWHLDDWMAAFRRGHVGGLVGPAELTPGERIEVAELMATECLDVPSAIAKVRARPRESK
jgi:hypothetical protein